MNPICEKCGLHEKCTNYKTEGTGNVFGHPKVVFIMPYPEVEDDTGAPWTGERAMIVRNAAESIGLAPDDYYMTYLVKCPTYKNSLTKTGFEVPDQKHIKQCLNHLEEELALYPDETMIMPFGKLTLKTLTGGDKIMQEVGLSRPWEFAGKKFILMPNLDPGMVAHQPNRVSEIKSHIQKAVSYKEDKNALDNKWKLLDFDSSIIELNKILDDFKAGKINYTVFDIESTALEPWKGDPIMFSFAHDGVDYGFAVPFVVNNRLDHEQFKDRFTELDFDIDAKQRMQLLAKSGEVLNTVPIVGHNLKFDVKWCVWHNICDINKVQIHDDTYNSSFQLHNFGFGRGSLSLKDLSRRHFNVTEDWEREVDDYRDSYRYIKDRHFGNIPTSMLGKYAALDALYTHKLYKYNMKNLPAARKKPLDLVNSAIIPFVEAEVKGIHFDRKTNKALLAGYGGVSDQAANTMRNLPTVRKLINHYRKPIDKKNANKKKPFTEEEIVDQAFKFRYAKKVTELMHDRKYYNLPINKEFKTKTGAPSTGKDAMAYWTKEFLVKDKLEMLRDDGAIDQARVDQFLECKEFMNNLTLYKRMGKLIDDYLNTFPLSMHEGLYRTDFKLNGTTTGRLASPFHSMPNRCDIKRLIHSRWEDEGGIILACDQSQLELRIIAALANEMKMIEAFRQGQDAHRFTASEVYGKPPHEITPEERQDGKTVNFGLVYGKTAHSLAADLGTTEARAQQILDNFYSGLQDLKQWKKDQESLVKSCGEVNTIFGRCIPVPNADSDRPADIAETERLAVNYPVQSSASDIVLSSFVDVYRRMKAEKLRSILLGTVHDSIETDIYPGELFQTMNILKTEGMDTIHQKFPWVSCPLRLDFEIGVSWGGALESKIDILEPNRCVLTCEGLSRDFMDLKDVASRAYNIDWQILETKDIPDKKYPPDILFRSNQEWKAKVEISKK